MPLRVAGHGGVVVGAFCCRTSKGVIEFGRDWNGE
jgi:hypothetical protein